MYLCIYIRVRRFSSICLCIRNFIFYNGVIVFLSFVYVCTFIVVDVRVFVIYLSV